MVGTPTRLTTPALWRIYRRCTLGDRLHVVIRNLMCPMTVVERHVPLSAEVLDIGCGHGVFAAHLVAGSPKRRILGVDLSQAKIDAANQADLASDRVKFRCAGYEAVDATFDAICMMDVLYLMPHEGHAAFFRWCHEHLKADGNFLIKEMGDRPRWKFWLTYLEELLAVRVFRITLGSNVKIVPPDVIVAGLKAAGFAVTVVPMHRGYSAPHLLFACRKESA